MSNNRVRVAFVVHQMQIAGAEVLISQIIERLKDNVEPTIFCLDVIGELGRELEEKGIPVIAFHRRQGIDKQLAFRLAREIRARRIQVVHAHQYTPFFYSALARMIGCWNTRLLFTEHGRHYPDIVSWKRRMVNVLFLSRLCNATTACCKFSANALKQIDGFSKVETIPNGVDVARYPPRGSPSEMSELRKKLGLANELLYVACVARFHPIKDHETLLRAWSKASPSVPNARLILVGDGSERAAMEKRCHELGLDGSVLFWGIRHDVGDILRAVDLFALSSISEAASLTLLEAMASQCPVVVTDVGGNAEHITQGVEGILVPRGNAGELGEKLASMLSNRETRMRMGEAARKRVISQFDLQSAVMRYGALYES